MKLVFLCNWRNYSCEDTSRASKLQCALNGTVIQSSIYKISRTESFNHLGDEGPSPSYVARLIGPFQVNFYTYCQKCKQFTGLSCFLNCSCNEVTLALDSAKRETCVLPLREGKEKDRSSLAIFDSMAVYPESQSLHFGFIHKCLLESNHDRFFSIEDLEKVDSLGSETTGFEGSHRIILWCPFMTSTVAGILTLSSIDRFHHQILRFSRQ